MKPAFIICMLLLGMGCKKDPQQHLYSVKCIYGVGTWKPSILDINIKNKASFILAVNGQNQPVLHDTIEYSYWNDYPIYTVIKSPRLYTSTLVIYSQVEDGKIIVYDSILKKPTATDTTYFKEYFTENKNR